jgi:hypothetical protein
MTVDAHQQTDINRTSNRHSYKDIAMNFNTTSFKHFIGSLVLISACALPAHAFAGDQTYSCSFTMSQETDPAKSQKVKMDIQASSEEDAKSKLKGKYATSRAPITEVYSCALKG